MEKIYAALNSFFISNEDFHKMIGILEDIQERLPSKTIHKKWVDINEASELVMLSKSQIYKLRMRTNGQGIPCHKQPGTKKLRFLVPELEAWMAQNPNVLASMRTQSKKKSKLLDSS